MHYLPLLAEAGFLTQLTSDFSSEQRFVLCLVALGCTTLVLIVVVSVCAGVWHSVRTREAEVELTRDLLDQGKTAEEIERIIRPADGFSRAIGNWWGGSKSK
ncbi:MAG: hypothetical protein AAF266_03750 [Planctomycetota bacterium]